jgi:anti-sigma regulatory factor (Ser/Thr protein kinase)
VNALPAPVQTRRLALFGAKGVVGRCRDFTREALEDWGWFEGADEDRQAVADDVLLLVSELVANACLHAGGPEELVLDLDQRRLRVEVVDASPVRPVPRRPGDVTQPGGHGLRVVERLAREWGSQPRGGGKAVWIEVDTP